MLVALKKSLFVGDGMRMQTWRPKSYCRCSKWPYFHPKPKTIDERRLKKTSTRLHQALDCLRGCQW